ncbi:hypothetical protein OE749_11435 [Aestuariibacter sp. AA17]|uniref:Flagellar biosynthetic protein FliO n=1 Tax=Fluctibacter corallii TaxID=2984329 RepID=A0ABT3A9M6_9ALTE|nr:hypothetical protein [Aestuariibacter sp. AA17]MCV2885305.1 hypothetical protein [Aestuariibacter sp. AA17]
MANSATANVTEKVVSGSELGLKTADAFSSGSWLMLIVICIVLLVVWVLLHKRSHTSKHQSYKHQRFPLGSHCYLVVVEAKGTRYTLYESPRGITTLTEEPVKPTSSTQ